MKSKYEDTLERVKKTAQEAASQGDPIRLFAILCQEHALDGLVRRLQSHFSSIPSAEIEEIIADSIDELYYKVRGGGVITNAIGFLWKTGYFKAQEYIREKAKFEKKTIDDLDEQTELADEPEIDLEEREKRRIEAIKTARSLLPRLKSQNIQDVLGFVIDAVEKGIDDLSNHVIADALGLSVITVKNCLYRGFNRLSRIAQEENVISQPFEFLQPEDVMDEEDNSEEEE
jgi:DNA-directed RNA polymerase specialized sigma24 family protein